MILPPHTQKMEPGGPYGSVDCDRCGDPATRSYEGKEHLDLCESCWEKLGEWLNSDDKDSKTTEGGTAD